MSIAISRARAQVDVRTWERLALAAIIALAAGLRLWRLEQNGYGDTYYAAGVRSMLTSWHNFFYASYDPGGFLQVDKPPVALWVQAAFAKLLGFSSFSLLLPQALAGVAVVALVYYLVQRVFGTGAGLLAALTVAITPISIAVDRDNNTDSLLVLVLLLAAWPMIRAAEMGRWRLLLLSAALVGVGFNVKMLAAYLVLLAFYLLYLVAAPISLRARLLHLAGATVVLLAVSLSWAVAVDLTPPDRRPFVGSSTNNTELNLILGHNGPARIVGGASQGRFGRGSGARGGYPFLPGRGPAGAGASPFPSGGPAGPGAASFAPGSPGAPPFAAGGGPGPFPFPPGGGPGAYPFMRGGMFGGGPPGPLRFADRGLAGQIAWLFPLAGIGLLAAAMRTRRRQPLDAQHQALLLWGVWLVTCGVVFSFARGIFHPYYTSVMAPPLAALVGTGAVALWANYREGGWRAWLLPATLLLTAAWETYILWGYPDWRRVLLPWLAGGTLVAAAALIAARLRGARPEREGGQTVRPSWAPAALAVGLFALFVTPAAWALTPVLIRENGMMPEAGPQLLARGGRGGFFDRGTTDNRKLIAFLRSHRQGERFFLATTNVMMASPIILETGEPVMAIGGFMGSDPILTVDQFARMVAAHQVRYVLVSSFGRRGGGNFPGAAGPGTRAAGAGGGRGGRAFNPAMRFGRNAELFRWIREHGSPVDPALWRSESANASADRAPGPPPAGGAGFPGLASASLPPAGQSPFGGGRGPWGGRNAFAQLFDLGTPPEDDWF